VGEHWKTLILHCMLIVIIGISQIEMCNDLKEGVIIVNHHSIWLDIAQEDLKVNSR